MCEGYWQKKGDKWIMVVAEEDELFLDKAAESEPLDSLEFPPIKPALEEPKEQRRPRAIMR